MNASALRVAGFAAPAPQPSPPTPVGQVDDASLARVTLAHVEQRITLALRFGQPAYTVPLDACRRVAVFLPGAVFCRTYWRANGDGAACRQLLVMQACTPPDRMQRVPGVHPGARILLRADRPRQVRAVLARIDAIEALGIAPDDAAPLYWLTLDHRLAARRPLPAYTLGQHALWRTGRAPR